MDDATIIREALSEYAERLRDDDDPENNAIADAAERIEIGDDGVWRTAE